MGELLSHTKTMGQISSAPVLVAPDWGRGLMPRILVVGGWIIRPGHPGGGGEPTPRVILARPRRLERRTVGFVVGYQDLTSHSRFDFFLAPRALEALAFRCGERHHYPVI